MESTNQNEAPAAPEFLRRSVDKAKLAGQRALSTGEPIGKTVELICNTLVEAIGHEGFGFAHSTFAPQFMAQARDNAIMREALAAVMVKVETEGQFTDAEAIKTVFGLLTPIPVKS